MSSGNRRNEETSQQYSRETNQYNALQTDPPPSYIEAMRNSPYPATYDPARPTAPYPSENNSSRPAVPPYSVENNSARPVAPPYSVENPVLPHSDLSGPTPSYSAGYNTSEFNYSNAHDSRQTPSAPTFETINGNVTYSSLQNDERYKQWNEESTRIFMAKRLEMEEQFRKAKTRRENELLWMMILSDLNGFGYNYSLLDIIWFWQIQSHLYNSVVSGVSGYNASWPYYQPMHQVYGGGICNPDLLSSTSSSMYSSTTVFPNNPSVFAPTMLPTPIPNNSSVLPVGDSNNLSTSILPTNTSSGSSNIQPSDTIASVVTADALSAVPSIGSSSDPSAIINSNNTSSVAAHSSDMLPPIDSATSSSLPVVPSSNNIPTFDSNNTLISAVPSSSETSNFIPNISSSDQAPLLTTGNDGSNILNSVQGSNINSVTESSLATDATASVIPTIAPESITLTESANLGGIGEVITTQPSEGLTLPKIFDENLITTQPTLSTGIYSGTTAAAVPTTDDNDCCGCCGDDDCCGDCDCEICMGDCGDCGGCDGFDL